MIRVFVADDHELFRAGLKEILQEAEDIVVAGEAACGEDAVAAIKEGDYDVLILDITMPGLHWLEVINQVHEVKPNLPVLILTMHPEEQYALRALRAGVAGYLTKNVAPDELIQAIRRVAQGRRYLSEALAEHLANYVTEERGSLPHEQLTDREYEVMCLIATGHNATQIAKALGLSIKTISTYRTRLLHKMGLANNAELIRYVLEHNLLPR